MAAEQKGRPLKNWQIMMVSSAMTTESVNSVARDYMGFTEDFMENIATENKDDMKHLNDPSSGGGRI